MKVLDALGVKFGTDKSSLTHNYLVHYEKYFEAIKDEPVTLLEIGIFQGNSMRMWESYFRHPQARFYGVDDREARRYRSDRADSFIGKQENRSFLETITDKVKQFDIIIDDGGHTMIQQQVSMGYLFPFVKPGGLYIIEDIHTSNVEKYNAMNTPYTTSIMLAKLAKSGKIESDYIEPDEAKYIEENFTDCVFESRKICFVRKNRSQ